MARAGGFVGALAGQQKNRSINGIARGCGARGAPSAVRVFFSSCRESSADADSLRHPPPPLLLGAPALDTLALVPPTTKSNEKTSHTSSFPLFLGPFQPLKTHRNSESQARTGTNDERESETRGEEEEEDPICGGGSRARASPRRRPRLLPRVLRSLLPRRPMIPPSARWAASAGRVSFSFCSSPSLPPPPLFSSRAGTKARCDCRAVRARALYLSRLPQARSFLFR